MKGSVPIIIIIIAVFTLFAFFVINSLPKEIGDKCTENSNCITKNCKNGVCSTNDIGGYCKDDKHCLVGICNNELCQEAKYNQRCNRNEDCEQTSELQLTCIENRCASNSPICQFQVLQIIGILAAIVGFIIIIFGWRDTSKFKVNLVVASFELNGLMLIGIAITIIGFVLSGYFHC